MNRCGEAHARHETVPEETARLEELGRLLPDGPAGGAILDRVGLAPAQGEIPDA